jgi:hypothetical protein
MEVARIKLPDRWNGEQALFDTRRELLISHVPSGLLGKEALSQRRKDPPLTDVRGTSLDRGDELDALAKLPAGPKPVWRSPNGVTRRSVGVRWQPSLADRVNEAVNQSKEEVEASHLPISVGSGR